jgi:signal transduction histidine kinase
VRLGVDGDAAELELALLNLMSNALDAMADGGTLTIRVLPHDSGVRIEVGDTGTGIAPDLIDRIFEPWVTTKPEGHGTGLGLSIVRSVIAEHRGTIRVHSAAGEGATFAIELPAGVLVSGAAPTTSPCAGA